MPDLTLRAVHNAALELTRGPQQPSLLFAIWAGILSAQKPLDMNGTQANALRQYVRSGLPTSDAAELAQIIIANGGHGWIYSKHAQEIIDADRLYRSGALSHLDQMPTSLREWVAWRKQLVRSVKGIGWKVASFIALLMWPLDTPFVPVDVHVATRLGVLPDYKAGKLSRKSEPGYRRYRAQERKVYAEWRAVHRPCTIAEWHWFMWEWQRVISGDASGEGVQSHALLNTREW